MVVFRFKLKSKTAAAAAAALAAVLAAVIGAFCAADRSAEPTVLTIAESHYTEEKAVGEYLDGLGYANRELVSCETVTIPKKFNDVYEAYNALQLQSGFDLSRSKGKSVRRYVYVLDEAHRAFVVILADGKVIGGHLTDGEYGGSDTPLRSNGKTG